MILKASQRAHGKELAAHLLHANDNEHVEVHEVSGFVANNVQDAFQEVRALSQGTRCQQYLFSVSFNPPSDEDVPTAVFQNAIDRVEEKMNLAAQPRVVVFHEKHGRRHAHCVWSRIDTTEMKAVNLPHYKNKLMEISQEIYLEQNWKLPQGFLDPTKRNPLNFTLEQWQQAKRLGDNPQITKLVFKECWEASDSRQAFSSSLKQHGFYLAKGDRRGFVAVDWRGEVYSLSRWLDVKTKNLKKRLGSPEDLPSVDEAKANIDQELVKNISTIVGQHIKRFDHSIAPALEQKKRLNERHIKARKALEMQQQKKQSQEAKNRQARFRKGLRGLWDRITGSHQEIIKQNETEAYQAVLRDRKEKDVLIHSHIRERSAQQQKFKQLHFEHQESMNKAKKAIFSDMPEEKMVDLEHKFDLPHPAQGRNFDLEM